MVEPALGVAFFWLAFAGTHIGLSTRRTRAALVSRWGEWGFVGIFSLIAAVTFAALIRFYAQHGLDGAAGPALGRAHEMLRVSLLAVAGAGLVLALASLASYPTSPYALGSTSAREPRGLARVSRHPFFAGVALFGAAHALLATRLAGVVMFGTLALYCVVGALHQDRRYVAQRGTAHAHFVAATSFLPFAAILTGRQRLVWRELPLAVLLGSAAVIYALRLAHESILAANGSRVIAVVLGGAALATLAGWYGARRAATRAATAS